MTRLKLQRNVILMRIAVLMCICGTAVKTANAQQPITLYDDWFHAATCRILTTEIGDSLAYTLAVTFDEGQIKVPEGSSLVLMIKGGTKLELFTDRDINKRRDVTKRRYRNRTDVYITCYFPITREQIILLMQNEITRLKFSTENGLIERRITNRKAFFNFSLP